MPTIQDFWDFHWCKLSPEEVLAVCTFNPPSLFLTPLCWPGAWCPMGKARTQISNWSFPILSILKATSASRKDTRHLHCWAFLKSDEQQSIFIVAHSGVSQKAWKVWEGGGGLRITASRLKGYSMNCTMPVSWPLATKTRWVSSFRMQKSQRVP